MSTINIEKISICHWYPEQESHRCGYCKNENGAVSYGMWAEQLTVEDYQNLIDRGWRRSGMYCYKPVMDLTCCPQYTIRCKALEFQPSKSQKKVVKKVNKFLNDGVGIRDEGGAHTLPEDESAPQERLILKEKPSNVIDFSKFNGSMEVVEAPTEDRQENPSSSKEVIQEVPEAPKSIEMGKGPPVKKGEGADPNRPPCKKAKLLRLEKRQKKLEKKGMVVGTPVNVTKSLEDFLTEISETSKHKLKMKLISTSKYDKEMESVTNLEYQLYKKYQMIVHNDPPDKCSMLGFTRFLISSPLKIKHERVNKNHATFKTCAALFKKYQMAVHSDQPHECGEKQFCEFLIDTPLKSVRVRGKDSVVTFGTFHQQYWLDDKLIAVAVLDILPRCVSSVYFFYDPDYRFLTLGTYGSLREVQFVQTLNKSIPSLEYYYMGFYIHSCPKMRYKGRLSRSYLLCPETYQWCPIEKCVPKLEPNKYSRLTDDIDAIDEHLCSAEDVDRIKVCVSYSFTVFGNYKRKYGEQEVFDNIGRLIGKKCATNLLFVSSQG